MPIPNIIFNYFLILIATFFCASCPVIVKADSVDRDCYGRINTVVFNNAQDQMQILTDFRVILNNDGGSFGMSRSKDVKTFDSNGCLTRSGCIESDEKKLCYFRQDIKERSDAINITTKIKAKIDLNIRIVYFSIKVPINKFKNGKFILSKDNGLIKKGLFPNVKPAKSHLISTTATGLSFADAGGNIRLSVVFDKNYSVNIIDHRKWNRPFYGAEIIFHSGKMTKEQEASLKVDLKFSSLQNNMPSILSINTSCKQYRFDGFGGNYCYHIESPVTQHTLNTLRVAWARTQMSLDEWEPKNDNDSPSDTNWDYLRMQAHSGSHLRHEMLLTQQIQKQKIPYSITIFRLPEWIYITQRNDRRVSKRRINPDKWPELLECIESYLVYGKKTYGIEPDLFSFNEPNSGAKVLFSAQEYCLAIKKIGSLLNKIGFKTKILLADVNGPRVNHYKYTLVSTNDTEAMRFVGAIGFHSWGGATTEQYKAWADLASQLNLPLLVAELGLDPSEWRCGFYESYAYSLQQLRMYQELLLYAKPQAMIYWQFSSGNNSMIKHKGKIKKADYLKPTSRFWFLKHFCNLTPKCAMSLETYSNNPDILITAFSGNENKDNVYTIHIANFGIASKSIISGFPDKILNLHAVLTSSTDDFKRLEPVIVNNGIAEVDLPSRSLITLTTAEITSK